MTFCLYVNILISNFLYWHGIHEAIGCTIAINERILCAYSFQIVRNIWLFGEKWNFMNPFIVTRIYQILIRFPLNISPIVRCKMHLRILVVNCAPDNLQIPWNMHCARRIAWFHSVSVSDRSIYIQCTSTRGQDITFQGQRSGVRFWFDIYIKIGRQVHICSALRPCTMLFLYVCIFGELIWTAEARDGKNWSIYVSIKS